MGGTISNYEIRAATCTVEDRNGFLTRVQDIARKYHTHIICFNADMLAGKRHADTAVRHAIRSFEEGEGISNTLEMEALLFAAGTRQCVVAATFGIHEGENNLWICGCPASEDMWSALGRFVTYQSGVIWEGMDPEKRNYLMHLFGVEPEELESLESEDRFADLVFERISLLTVTK